MSVGGIDGDRGWRRVLNVASWRRKGEINRRRRDAASVLVAMLAVF